MAPAMTEIYTEGWQAFAALPSEEMISMALPGEVEWPKEEVHKGIFRANISMYGDDEGQSYFLEVVGTNQSDVEAMFHRIRDAFNLKRMWSVLPVEGDRPLDV